MILEGIVSLIMAQGSGVSALIGSRVYPELLPENPQLPAITYYISGGTAEPTFEGSGMQKLRVHFDCHALTYGQAIAAREALRKLLNGAQGLLPDGTFLGNAQYIGPVDSPFGRTARQFRLGAEFYLFYNFND
jgi:hypothetical protein